METLGAVMTIRTGVLVIAALASLGGAAESAPILSAPQNNASASASGGNLAVGDSCGGPMVSGSAPVSAACSVGAGAPLAYAADAAASAGFGVVRIGTSAYGHAVGPDLFGSNANASAYALDYFAISGPANTSGMLHGSFVLSGSVSAAVTGAPESVTAAGSSYSVQTSLAGLNGAGSGNITVGTNGTNIQSNVSGGVIPVDASIHFGPDGWAVMSVSMYAQLHSDGTARSYQQCSNCQLFPGEFQTSAAFGNTIYWGGISAVTVNGVDLTGYEYLSASGADYRVATVPVPAVGWLFGSGLLCLAGAVRRKISAAAWRMPGRGREVIPG